MKTCFRCKRSKAPCLFSPGQLADPKGYCRECVREKNKVNHYNGKAVPFHHHAFVDGTYQVDSQPQRVR